MMRIGSCVAALVAVLFAPALAGAPPLVQAGVIDLPSVNGRIDHLAYDGGRRLFVAALGNNTVEVVAVPDGPRVRSLAGFHMPQGIAVAPDLDRAFVANGEGEGLDVIAAGALGRVQAVRLGDDSDNVRYDAGARMIYVGYGSGALAAVKAADGAVTGRVALPAHPESFQLESNGSRIFVNLPDAHEIAVVDRAALKVAATWPVRGAAANFPMALDEAGHRLFVGCRRPATLLVYDTQTGRETASAAIVGDTDDLFFDAARRRVYVIGGEGFIDVLDVSGPTPTRIARLTTAAGARTGLFVPSLSRLFLAVPHRGAQRAEIRVFAVHP
jgi:DNA-binding beta-propeller fold protein YncE